MATKVKILYFGFVIIVFLTFMLGYSKSSAASAYPTPAEQVGNDSHLQGVGLQFHDSGNLDLTVQIKVPAIADMDKNITLHWCNHTSGDGDKIQNLYLVNHTAIDGDYDLYTFKVNDIAPKDASDMFRIRLVSGKGQTLFNAYVSVKKYLQQLYEVGDVDQIHQVELIANWCAACQVYFGHNPGALCNEFIPGNGGSFEDVQFREAADIQLSLSGIEYFGTSVLLDNVPIIRHYFEIVDPVEFENIRLSTSYTGMKGNLIYFDFKLPSYFDLDYESVIIIGDSAGSVYKLKYSFLDYMNKAVQLEDEELKNVILSMYQIYSFLRGL